ncbi:MAG: efflux RND transporter periplasmic adaptor subunit [Eubacterium sp.]|nr:efflux RND transporter periplasmic adaptor subunit [Eubacterium sp.]
MEENKKPVTLEKIEEGYIKKSPKQRRKNSLFIFLALLIMIGVGVWYYFYWEGNTYFSTDNARVTSKTYPISVAMSGKLLDFSVKEGDFVVENEILGFAENSGYIKSPINGQIVKSNAVLNQVVSPASPVLVVADVYNMHIGANIEETDIIKIKEGQSADIEIDAFQGQKFHGNVYEIDYTTQTALSGNLTSFSTSGTYTKVTQLIPVKISILEDVDLTGLIGVNATVKIKIK